MEVLIQMNNKLNLFTILAILILPLLIYSMVKTSDEDLAGASIAAGTPMVIKFSSPMCADCKKLDKVLKTVEPKYSNKVVFQKYSVNSNNANIQNNVRKYGVKVVPTMVFIDKNGKMIKRTEGSMSSSQLEGILKELTNG